jgi:hypothetical protein
MPRLCFASYLNCFNGKTNRRALFILQLELDKRGLGIKIKLVCFDIATSYGNGFDRLIDGSGPNGLNLDLALTTQQRRNGSSNRVGLGIPRYT